jgi:simple sugar transport system ATP-binding protein
MVGRDVVFRLDKKNQEPGEVVLSVDEVYALNDKDLPALRGVSLSVRSGEIVGLAGVAGNGQRELAQVISGMRECAQGEIRLHDIEIGCLSVRSRIRHGVGYIPEDRTHVGTAPNLSVTDNVIMKKYRVPPIARGWMIDMNSAASFAENLKNDYDIIVPNVETPVRLLSGGNLQRVILAREISGEPTFLLAMQPTRGLDVGAIEGVHRLLLAQREAGSAILLVSEELEELLALSDRVYVIYEGEIMGEVMNDDMDLIGQMMTGTRKEHVSTPGASPNV